LGHIAINCSSPKKESDSKQHSTEKSAIILAASTVIATTDSWLADMERQHTLQEDENGFQSLNPRQ